MVKWMYRLASALPAPKEITVSWDWGHDFMLVLPFVALVHEDATLGDGPCDIAHENVHTVLDIVSIVLFAIGGFALWPGGLLGAIVGAAAGHVFYAATNAVEGWPPEQLAEAVERYCKKKG